MYTGRGKSWMYGEMKKQLAKGAIGLTPKANGKSVVYRTFDEFAQLYPATWEESFTKEETMSNYFVKGTTIHECEVPKRWDEAGFAGFYRSGFEDGLDGRSGGTEVDQTFTTRLQAEAYVEGYQAGSEA